MATLLKNKLLANIGTTPVDVLTTGSSNNYTVIGCNLANTTDEDVIIDITVTDTSSVTAYYIKQLVIPPYNSLKVITNGEKLILAENCTMHIVSDTNNSVDAIISYAEIV